MHSKKQKIFRFDRDRNGFALRLLLLYLTPLFCMGFQLKPNTATVDESCSQLQHIFINPEDSLETVNITECQFPNGLTNWFSSDINKSVCTDKQCRMVNIRLFWDGVGNYHHFELIDNEPLTKTDHSIFTVDDYEKLDLILTDSSSVFKDLRIEDLVIEKKEDVDGVSGATRKSLSDYVVRDAVYTCYTLWHTVYGLRKSKINDLLEQRTNQEYLRKAFTRNHPAVDFWILNTIMGRPQYSATFLNELIVKIASGNDLLSNLSLKAISPFSLSGELSQMELVNQIPKIDDLKRLDIIWKLNDCPVVHEKVVIQLLIDYQNGIINPTALSYVYKIISGKKMMTQVIAKRLKEFLTDKNEYIRNITNRLITTPDIDQAH